MGYFSTQISSLPYSSGEPAHEGKWFYLSAGAHE